MKTQRNRILERLKEGQLNSYEATYEMRIKQAPTRIKELKDRGYNITSVPNKDRSVTWVLDYQEPKPKQYIFENGVAKLI